MQNGFLFNFLFSAFTVLASSVISIYSSRNLNRGIKFFTGLNFFISSSMLLLIFSIYGPPIDGKSSYFFGLISGLIVSVLAISIFLLKNQRDLNSKIRLPFDKNSKKVKLRDLLHIAVKIEETGMLFYRALKNKVTDQKLINLFDILSQDEKKHSIKLQKQLRKWMPYPIGEKEMEKLNMLLDEVSIFNDMLPENIDQIAILKYAHAQEIRMAEFYLQFGNSYKEQWKNSKILEIHADEIVHAKKIEAMMKAL